MSPSKPLLVLVASFWLFVGGVSAQKALLSTQITGPDGRPAKAAEVAIERQDKKMARVIVQADARGNTQGTSLEPGTYRVTALLADRRQSSQVVQVRAGKPLLIAFDLSKPGPQAASAAKKKRYVWVKTGTGTHLDGHFEEMNDDAPSADDSQARRDGAALDRLRTGISAQPSTGGR